ncbi:MAG: TRAP transporter substrate-binding protein DctP [Pseudomonadota bacterium]
MRSVFFGVMVLFALLFGSLGDALARCQGSEVPLRFAVQDGATHPVIPRLARLTASTINVELQGKACLTLVEDAQKFEGLLVVNALTGDEVDVALIELSRLTVLQAGYGVFQLPFVFRDYRVAQKFSASAPVRALGEALAQSGLVTKGIVHGGFLQLTGKKALMSPNDLLGLRFRPSRFDKTELGPALRAVPQNLLEADLSEAIKDGRVEAQSNDWAAIRAGDHGKLHDGITVSNHAYHGYALVLSKRWWDAQTPQLQKDIEGTFARVVQQTNFETSRRISAARRLVMQAGVPVRLLTRGQLRAWRAAVEPVWQAFDAPERSTLMQALTTANAGP